jgi:hypothetical protein
MPHEAKRAFHLNSKHYASCMPDLQYGSIYSIACIAELQFMCATGPVNAFCLAQNVWPSHHHVSDCAVLTVTQSQWG